ncbi:MAG: hypothetical protein V7731_19440, partial [Amphritea sp.]
NMTGTAVNDAPTATNLNAAEGYTEDTVLDLTDILVTDVDSANVTVTLTLSDIAAGSFSTATSGAVTSTYDAATGEWSASGAIGDVNTLLAGVVFAPAQDYNSNFSIATSVDDGVATPVTGVKNMTGTAVNDAPTATNLNAAEGYTEDTVLDLTDIVVTDVDSATVTVTLTLSDVTAGSLSTATSGAVTSTYDAGTGVWSASGAIGDVNTLLAGVLFAPAQDYNSNFSIATSVDDGVATPVTGVKNMTGTAVNDAPIFYSTEVTAATEDAAYSYTIITSDVDGDTVSISATTLPGWLTLTDNNNGTATLYGTPTIGEVGDHNVVLLVSDGSLSDTQSFTVNVIDVNEAPSMTGANNLASITEDPVINPGTLVSDLIAGQATDPDFDAAGIAVIAVDNSNGTWQYSINSGGSWTAFGTPGITAALLLADDANTYVRFVPDANWNGTVTDGITFHTWDQTSGTEGGSADLGPFTETLRDEFTNSPSYANNQGSVTWSGNWVENDSAGPMPVNTGNFSVKQEMLEIFPDTTGDWIYRQADLRDATSATLSFYYDNNLAGAQQIDLQVSSDGGGTFTTIESFSTGSHPGIGTIIADISAYTASDLQVRFYVATGESSNPNNTLKIDDLQIEFVSNAVGGTTAFSTDTASSDIKVNPVNDLPVGLPSVSGMVQEGQTLSANTGGISDADSLGSFSYKWLRDGSAISGASSASYLLGGADIGAQVSVKVSYTDGQGTVEKVTSAQTALVANVNDLPVGLPSISGMVQEGQSLSANTTGISDVDGLGSFSYQWLRDGSAISGASSASYLLGGADINAQVSVKVSYTDGYDTNETVTSTQTSPVASVYIPVDDDSGLIDEDDDLVTEDNEAAVEDDELTETASDTEEGLINVESDPGIAATLNEAVQLPPVDSAVPADVLVNAVANVQSNHTPYDHPGPAIKPIPPKAIDLHNLDITPFAADAYEPLKQSTPLDNASFVAGLDAMKQDLDEVIEESEVRYQLGGETAIGFTMSLSAWFVIWMFRAGSLLACFFSVVPLWMQFDPLPVLGGAKAKKAKGPLKLNTGESNSEDDRVEELFQQKDSH